jgi:hypothetical protein
MVREAVVVPAKSSEGGVASHVTAELSFQAAMLDEQACPR